MATTQKDVQAYTAKAIHRILNMANPAAQKAALANLRRGIGHEPGEIPQLWGEFLLDLPEEMFGRKGLASREEWAVYTALTLFALHQQGHVPNSDPMHIEGQTFGAAVARLATDEDEKERVLRHLNATATANSIAALAHYLRGLIQLLRAQHIPLDYGRLAGDIYSYQFPERINQVRLKWGQDFYGYYKNNKKEDEES